MWSASKMETAAPVSTRHLAVLPFICTSTVRSGYGLIVEVEAIFFGFGMVSV